VTASDRPTGEELAATSEVTGDESGPAPRWEAWRAVGRSVVASGALLARRRVRFPRDRVGLRLRFADGSSARVFRETRVDGDPPSDPCVLVIGFRLRLIRGRAHRLFEAESILNTPLFVGFPGMVSKLWVAHDRSGVYRGLYEWDTAVAAHHYASSLWRVLEIGCVPGSIHYHVLPGLRRDDVLADPASEARGGSEARDGSLPDRTWWRLIASW
jgi:hypothetical protein